MGRGDGPSILTGGSSQIGGRAIDTEWQSERDDWMLFRRPGEAEDARVARLARARRCVSCSVASRRDHPTRDGPPFSVEQSARRLGDDQVLRAATRRTAGPDPRAARTASSSESASAVGRPSIPNRPTIRARTGAACSPIPPVNTSPSRRGSAVAPRRSSAARRTNSSIASAARSSPAASRSSSSRISACRQRRGAGTCSRPSSELVGSDAGVQQADEDPGSTEPERVPIIRPSSGVMPIEVQAERPASTAVTEQPLPRCATTSARSEDGVSSSSAARAVAHSTDSPWKPNRRRPCRSVHDAGSG